MEFSDFNWHLWEDFCLPQNSMLLYNITVTLVTADLTKTNIPHHNINIVQRITILQNVCRDDFNYKKKKIYLYYLQILTDHYSIQIS